MTGLSPSMLIMMELTNPDGTFPRKTTEGQKLWDQFAVGDTIDCLDTVSKWYESTVRAVKDHNILVHFDGWARNWDEWIDRDSDRLAPRGSHTDGPRQKTSSMVASNKLGSPVRPGCVGLTNLGNTVNPPLLPHSHPTQEFVPTSTQHNLTQYFIIAIR